MSQVSGKHVNNSGMTEEAWFDTCTDHLMKKFIEFIDPKRVLIILATLVLVVVVMMIASCGSAPNDKSSQNFSTTTTTEDKTAKLASDDTPWLYVGEHTYVKDVTSGGHHCVISLTEYNGVSQSMSCF